MKEKMLVRYAQVLLTAVTFLLLLYRAEGRAEGRYGPQLLPGALRSYRSGIHEGVDFYCPSIAR